MVQPVGIEPTSTVLQTAAMTTSAKVAYNLVPLLRFERRQLLLLREPTLPICPQGHYWYLVTGLNRRHSTCKEDATTAELTRHKIWGVVGNRTLSP
jgi:hypothetical protein